jgi:hypothetical protein
MPAIASILTVSGLATNQGQGHPRTGRVALVGVVLDDGRVGWGTCPLGLVADPDWYPDQPEVAQAAAVMSDLASPALQGRPLDDWVALAERVEALIETVTITRTLPEVEESGLSRRAVLTGRLQKPAEAPVERVTIERPFWPQPGPAGRLGLLARVEPGSLPGPDDRSGPSVKHDPHPVDRTRRAGHQHGPGRGRPGL